MSERDPASARWDTAAEKMLRAAVAARHRDSAAPGHAARGWVESRPAEFRQLDRGGRTKSERQFTRAMYHRVTTEDPRQWSLKLSWGPIEKRGARWGRAVTARLYRYAAGQRHVSKNEASSYVVHEHLRSREGDRIDQAG